MPQDIKHSNGCDSFMKMNPTLNDIIDMLNEAHKLLAKSRLSIDDYASIGRDLIEAKRKLYKIIINEPILKK